MALVFTTAWLGVLDVCELLFGALYLAWWFEKPGIRVKNNCSMRGCLCTCLLQLCWHFLMWKKSFSAERLLNARTVRNVIVVALHASSKWTTLLYVFIKKDWYSEVCNFFLCLEETVVDCVDDFGSVSILLNWFIAHYEAGYFRKSLKRWMLTFNMHQM